MRISDWSSDVCSSDLIAAQRPQRYALRRRIGRAAVTSPELRKTRHVAQHIFNPPARVVRQSLAPNCNAAIGGRTGRQRKAFAGDEDGLVGSEERRGGRESGSTG